MRGGRPFHNIAAAALAFALWAAAGGVARAQDFRLRFPDNKATYREIFTEIEKQGSVWFAYTSQDFEGTGTVAVPQGGSLSLGGILDLIFRGTDYTYRLDGKHVFITRGREAPDPVFDTPPTVLRSSVNPNTSRRRGGDRELIRAGRDSTFKEVRHTPGGESAFVCLDRSAGLSAAAAGGLPRLAVKVDLLRGAVARTPNLAVESGLGLRNSVELSASYNPRRRGKAGADARQMACTVIRAEFRHWLCERCDGHFLGAHLFYADYDVAGFGLPPLFRKGSRYDGRAVGAGATYGYHLSLSGKWGVEFSAGLGLARMDHGRSGGAAAGTGTKLYAGPTRLGAAIVYIIR